MMKIELKTEQKLALSARMIQSAEILQMTSLDLTEYLNEMALENPVIDLASPPVAEHLDAESQRLKNLEQLSSVSYTVPETQESHDEDDSSDDWKFRDAHEESLTEYLWSQLLTTGLPKEDMSVLQFMLYCLDERGYLEDDIESLAAHLQRDKEDILRLLGILQGLDPAGVGAQNLSECLLLQAGRLGILTSDLDLLIREHLDDIAKNHLPAICSSLGCTMAELNQNIRLIKSLNPKPGMAFSDRRQLNYLTPDVTVVKFQNRYDILPSDTRFPEIHINEYYAHLAQTTDAPEVLEYLNEKIRQADWLKTCISQRSQTLMAITRAIVEFQKDFFTNGKAYLKPLRMADVAAAAGIHESTVSRAVRGKYLQCMWGIYPLNYFFPKGIFLSGSAAGNDTPPDQASDVKEALRVLIDGENKKKPYSDRILAEQLATQGYSISRRTVAKYRDQMGIGDASGRKRYD